MRKSRELAVLLLCLVCLGTVLNFRTPAPVNAEPVTIDVIRNGFALGVDNDYCPIGHDPDVELINFAEWSYDEYISISKCGQKNSHPYDLNLDGAMFKNGPIENSGLGLPNVPAHMWQEYDLVSLGVSPGTLITVDIKLELVSVGGTLFTAIMESSLDKTTWTPEATLIQWPQESCGFWKYPLYCGSAVVPYAPYYRLALTSIWAEQLGQKWVIHNLNFSFESDSVTLPTATATPSPTITPTPLPTATFTPTPSATITETPLPTVTFTPTASPSSTPISLPSLSFINASILEGDEGIITATFSVNLNKAAEWPIEVNYETYSICCGDPYAEAGSDYVATAGTLVFNAGETVKAIKVLVIGDAMVEKDEIFFVKLSTNDSVTLTNSTAVGQIINDDQNDTTTTVGFQLFLPIVIND